MRFLLCLALGSWFVFAFTGCADEYEVAERRLLNKTPYFSCVKHFGFPVLAAPKDMAFCTDMKECNKLCETYRNK